MSDDRRQPAPWEGKLTEPDQLARQVIKASDETTSQLYDLVDEMRQHLFSLAIKTAPDSFAPLLGEDDQAEIAKVLKRERDFHEAHFGPSRERDEVLYHLTGERDYRDPWVEE